MPLGPTGPNPQRLATSRLAERSPAKVPAPLGRHGSHTSPIVAGQRFSAEAEACASHHGRRGASRAALAEKDATHHAHAPAEELLPAFAAGFTTVPKTRPAPVRGRLRALGEPRDAARAIAARFSHI